MTALEEIKEKLETQVRETREEAERTQSKLKAAAAQFETDMQQLAAQHRDVLESSQVLSFHSLPGPTFRLTIFLCRH